MHRIHSWAGGRRGGSRRRDFVSFAGTRAQQTAAGMGDR